MGNTDILFWLGLAAVCLVIVAVPTALLFAWKISAQLQILIQQNDEAAERERVSA